MSITLKNINELTPNEANANDKIAFGKPNNTELFSEGVGALIARFASGIEDFSYQVIPIPVLLTDPLPSTSLGLTVNNIKGMITFIRVNVLVDDSLGSDTYLLLKGEGTHTGLIYNDLLRVDRKEGDVESSPNTVTYVVNSLNEINESVNPFDFSDEDLFYFLRIDGSLFSFIGANGFYGLNDLQITEQDIQLVGGANDIILDNQLNINSSNGVQNSVILSEFLRTNYLGIKLDDSILTQSGLESVNYKFLHKIENNNVSVLGRFDAPIDFNCYGIVEQGSITFSVQAGLVLLAPNGTTVNVGEYFHFNKINDGKTYVLIRASGGGLGEAPIDGQKYVRQDSAWEVLDSDFIPIEYATLVSPANQIDLASPSHVIYNQSNPTSAINFTLVNMQAGRTRQIEVQNNTNGAPQTITINGSNTYNINEDISIWDDTAVMIIYIHCYTTTDFEWWFYPKKK